MFERRPILEGRTDVHQAEIIFKLVGHPTEENMPGWQQLPGCEGIKTWLPQKPSITSRFQVLGPEGLDLLQQLMKLDWRTRINATDALNHKYFTTLPLPAKPENIPRYEDSHELDRRKHNEKRAALPPAPAGGAVGIEPDEPWGGTGPFDGDFSNGYHDRGRFAPRGPPGVPAGPPPARGRYDDRGAPPPPRERDDRRAPAWARGPPADARGDGRRLPTDDRAYPLPPMRGGGPPGATRNDVDSYIPNYTAGGPPPRRDGELPPRRRSRENKHRDRDRDRDRVDRDRARDGDREHRRHGTRSRSPLGDRNGRERDRERERDSDRTTRETRERLQDRERAMYRR